MRKNCEVRYRRQVFVSNISYFKRLNYLMFSLRSSEDHMLCDDFREYRS